jgi:hypothetical protein
MAVRKRMKRKKLFFVGERGAICKCMKTQERGKTAGKEVGPPRCISNPAAQFRMNVHNP